ncbi:MAG: M48 family metallopeptidase [Streptosporangiaceae bacterium]
MAAPVGRTPSHAGAILGMYALLATAVGCVGASAGELFFAADRTLSTPFQGALNRCSLSYPILTHAQQYDRCLVGAYRFKGLFLLGCVGYMLLFTAALIVVGPWLTRRRLARAQQYTQTQAVTARFESLCDRAGLTGRRPRLAVAAVREAYTTVLPDGRPLVVLPLKTTLDPSRFDPVVLHELAHVRARDVSLVSSVRGIAWITIPVVALASLPDILDAGQTQVPQAYLVQAVVFVAATILVAAGLLRLREIAADRQAARWLDSPQPLRNLLDTAEVPAGTAPNWSRWRRRLLARHPSVTARLAALGSPLTVRDVGFATALAVGAVAAMAMNTCSYFASSLDYAAAASLPPRVWAATGGVVLGLGLAPAFLRSAAQARLAGVPYAWWAPVAGVSLGLLLGSVAAPGTATNAVLSVVVGSGFGGVATAVILACAGAGLAALAAGLASLAAERYPHRPAWLVAGVTVVIACCSAGALVPVRLTSAGLDWHVLIFDLQATPWHSLLLLLYPAAVIALAVPSRGWDVHGPAARAAVSAAITPAGAAVIAVAVLMAQGHLDEPPNATIALQWLQENWWVCAFTGWAVLVILVLARGMAGLARACVTAWLTTVLVCVGSVAYEAVVQGAPFVHLLSGWTNASSVWLFFLALPTSLLALVRIRRPAVLQRSWLVPAGASTAAAAAAVLVFVTGIPGLLDDPAATPFPYPCGTMQPALPFLALDADQGLTTTAARHVIDGVCVALPVGWTGEGLIPSDAPTGHVTIQPAGCKQLWSAGYLSVLGHPVTQADGNYQMAYGALAGTEGLTVLVNSFSRPVPSSIFTAADTDLAPCHRYAVARQGGTLMWTVQRFSAPEGGVRTWGTDRSTSYRARGGFVGETITWVMASVGRDLIIVIQQTETLGLQPPPNATVVDAALTAMILAFRQTALSPAQACYEFRAAANGLVREIGVANNGYNNAQRADYSTYGATLVRLGGLLSKSRPSSGLAQELELMGVASRVVGEVPDRSAAETKALTVSSNAYRPARKACIAFGAWQT